MTHEELKALLPLAALDRLEPEEAAALREHLAGCLECETELRELEHAASMLALTADAPASGDRVMGKLEARLAASAPQTARARTPVRVVEPSRREGGRRLVPRLAIAAAILLAIYGGAVTSRMLDLKRAYDDRGDKLVYLQNRFGTLEHDARETAARMDALSKMLSERIQLEHVLDAPDLQVTRLAPLPPAPEANAIVAVSISTHTAVLRANGLAAPPAGKTYELWWITKQKGPVPAGTFTAATGTQVIAKVDAPPVGEQVIATAVTLEAAGGVPKPTGAMYLKGSPERE